MKTLQECKDEVAKWHEFESFDTARNSSSPVDLALVIIDEAAELYAQQFKEENSRLLEEKAKLIEENKQTIDLVRRRAIGFGASELLNVWVKNNITSPQ